MGVDVISLLIEADSTQVRTADKDLAKLTGTANATEKATQSLAREFRQLLGGITIAATVAKTITTYKEFSRAISDLSAITGATGDDLRFYSDQAKEMGKTTTQSASQIAEAFKLVASAKPDLLKNKEALAAVTKEVVTLSEAAGLDMVTASKAAATSLNQFGQGADQASRFVNVLAAGAKFGASEIADTAEAMKNAGTTASALGLSFEEANAAIQLIAAAGIKAGEAGTGLRGVLLRLATQTRDEFNPEVVGLAKAFENLAAAQLTTAEKEKLFGRESIQTANALVQQAGALASMTEQLTGTSVAYEQAAIRTNDLQGDTDKLLSALASLAITIGEKLDPYLRSAAQSFAQFASFVSDNIAVFSEIAKWVGIIVALNLAAWIIGVAAQFVIAAGQAYAYQVAIAAATASTEAAALAMGGLRSIMALLGGPVGVIAGVVAVAASFFFTADNAAASTTNWAREVAVLNNNLKEMQRLDLSEKLRQATADVQALTQQLHEGNIGFFDVLRGINPNEDVRRQLNDAKTAVELLQGALDDLDKPAAAAAESVKEVGAASKQAAQDMIDLHTKLKEQLGAIGLTEDELLLYNTQLEISKQKNKALAPEIMATAKAIIAKRKEQDALNDALDEAIRLDEANKRAYDQRIVDNAMLVDQMRKEAELLQLSDRERAIEIASRRLSAEATAEQTAEVRKLAAAAYDAQKKLLPEKSFAVVWEEAIKRIDDAFMNLWKSAFSGFSDFKDAVKNAFIQLLAEMAHAAITRPIVIGISTALMGGSPTGAIASTLGGGSSPLSSGLSSLFSGTGALSLAGLSQGFGLAATNIADFGFFGSAGANLSLAGDSLAAGSLGTALGAFSTYLPIIGGALQGFANNGWVGAVTGGGGAALGAAIGSAIAPGIGTIIGGMLGGFVGSSIGPKPSNKGQVATIDLNTGMIDAITGSQTNSKFSAENRALADQLAEAAADYAKLLRDTFNVTFSDSIAVSVGSRDGLRLASSFVDTVFNPDLITWNPEQLAAAMFKGITERAEGLSQEIKDAVGNLDFTDLNSAVQDLQFIFDYVSGDMFDTTAINQAQAALDQLNAQFDAIADTAERLGLSVVKAEQERQKAIVALTTGFNTGIQEQIMQIVDPLQYALDIEAKAAQERLDSAAVLGANLVEVERLNALKRQQIIEQFSASAISALESANDKIKNFLTGLRTSGEFYSPQQTLTNAQDEFNRLLALARSTDDGVAADARDAIVGAADALINANRDVYGSTEMFFQSLGFIESTLSNLIGDQNVTSVSTGDAISQLDLTVSQGNDALEYQLVQLNSKIDELTGIIETQQETIARLVAA